MSSQGVKTKPSESQHLAYYGAVNAEETNDWDKTPLSATVVHEDLPPSFQDVPFSVLFVAHLAAMLYLGVQYGSWDIFSDDAMESNDDKEGIGTEGGAFIARIVLHLAAPCAAMAFFLAFFAASTVIPSCPSAAIGSCLAASVLITLFVACTMVLSHPVWYTCLLALVIVAASIYYAFVAWRLIPFAAANLKMALLGISANWGIYLVAILISAVSFVWYVAWLYIANGVLGEEQNGQAWVSDCGGEYDDACAEVNPVFWGYLFLLLVSLYWTSTVLLNTIQVTVAGVMATWCFDKSDASSCCSPAVGSSLFRSVTYSFGSICFGSLLEALITALRVIVENARSRREDNECSGGGAILLCILDCILSLLEDIIEYFNKWAYVFVGIYGYSYLESGRKVIELFRARGWTAVITNDLVGYVLNFTSLVVGIVTGLVAVVFNDFSNKSSLLFGDVGGSRYWAFGIGFIVGFLMSAIMMNVIKGAINTLIVCYADAPAKLEENHPRLTCQMAKAWLSVFPDCGVRVQQQRDDVAM